MGLRAIANLAMADLRRLPPGPLPPVVLGMDASSQAVRPAILEGAGLNETQLKDLAQFQVRNPTCAWAKVKEFLERRRESSLVG
jgi:hypothetical protein